MKELNIALFTVGTLVLLLGLVSDFLKKKWWASAPIISLIFGILLGSVVLGVLDPAHWGFKEEVILEQAARFTLAIGLMGVALRLPKNYVFQQWKPLGVLLGFVMPLMWLTSGFIIYFLLGYPFWESMLIGSIITPTDPIVCSSIVTGIVAKTNLPGRLRHLISAESGANDGLAYPFVLLCILMINRPPVEALSHWITRVVVWEVGGAVVCGAILGYGAGRVLEWAEHKKTIEEKSFLGYTIALSLTVLRAAKLIGTDGVLAVFVAGLLFSEVVRGKERAEEENTQEAINRFFTLPIFVLLGLTIPWQEWVSLGWKGMGLVIAILLLRRLPIVLLMNGVFKPFQSLSAALFTGWFGPIGVAAVFYSGYSMSKTGFQEIWGVVSLVICASILAHGFTSTPLTKLYGRQFNSQQQKES